jgi:light-regulated signal transduction histidine kinase (bacteriophytochrome)
MANVVAIKERVSVKDMIINVIDLLDPPDNIKITFDDKLPTLITEKIKLHEVFQNLISNAIKYNDKKEGNIEISFLNYPTHFEFIVQDNGCGIKEEHYEKIYGIFQTLVPKDKSESTGIGLTIVKKIVEQQGGVIRVDSIFGKGSIFKFTWKK